MSGESNNKDKPTPSSGGPHRPAAMLPPQTQPGQWPMSMPTADYAQSWHHFFQWQAMAAYQQQQQMAFIQQQAATAAQQTAGSTSSTSPRGKDDLAAVKVVKPKDSTLVKAIQTPAGIQSPKPNSPGFLLGAAGGKGGSFRAFSPYTSRSDTPGALTAGVAVSGAVPGEASTVVGCVPLFPHAFPPPGVFDYYIVDSHEEFPALPQPPPHNGVDLTKASSTKKSRGKAKSSKASAATKEKKEDPQRPVGIVKARHRAPADCASGLHSSDAPHSDTGTPDTPSSSGVTTTSVVTTGTTVIASVPLQVSSGNAAAAVTGSAWAAQPSFHPALPAYMAAPYQSFALAQPGGGTAMYMMPTHRPMFAGQPPVPGYLPVAPQSLMNMPELTVKTSQHQQLVMAQNASTSPSKPVSAASSPKSPLDKFREKLNDKNNHKSATAAGVSRQASPTNSESKSISSESTEKFVADSSGAPEKLPHQTSVIVEPPQRNVLLKPAPTKRERKEKSSIVNNRNKTGTQEKGPKAKVRRTTTSGGSSVGSPLGYSATDVSAPSASKLVATSSDKPLIAPARLKLDTSITAKADADKHPPLPSPFSAAAPTLLLAAAAKRSKSDKPVKSPPAKATAAKAAAAKATAAKATPAKSAPPPRVKRSSSKDSSDKPTIRSSKSSSVERRINSRERRTSGSNMSTTICAEPEAIPSCGKSAVAAVADEREVAVKESPKVPSGAPPATTLARPSKQPRSRKLKRKSTDSAADKSMEVKAEPLLLLPVPSAAVVMPTNVENKPYLWAEDAFDPVIVKHNGQVYDVCQDEDLKLLETSLKSRLKMLTTQVEDHGQFLRDESRILTLPQQRRRRSLSSNSESQISLRSPTSPDKPRSCFSVRSDSHPSLKMKAAAKAKSRASQSEDKEAEPVKEEAAAEVEPAAVEPPAAAVKPAAAAVKPAAASVKSVKSKKQASKSKKIVAPLSPIVIPERNVECRKLTKNQLLSVDGLILTCIEGLFYESRIKPIEPPDIYGVVIDGERHSKPRIFTEEELLSNTFTNLTPVHLSQLEVGTRVCAYWSDMIGCLYPGTVTALYPSAGTNSKHLIDIEYDDGDSGKFPLYQIRLLPYDYPHVEYDSTNIIPVGRRRRCSTVPETPPIMTTPPSDRSRLSHSTLPRDSTQYQVGKKRGRPTKGKAAAATLEPGSEAFDQSTDDELLDSEEGVAVNRWEWLGSCTKRQARGRGSKEYYQSITKDGEVVKIGDCAVFKSVGGPGMLPYIGQVQSMWEGWGGKMVVNIKWFYHPEELEEVKVSIPKYKGALFHSEHIDENDVQTISHKCEVISYEDYLSRKLHLRSGEDRAKFSAFYLAGNYDAGRRKVKCVYV